jgi:2-oxoglutarate/2-oxoacid ferredoxin oxidoreductase subunit alpha
MFVLGFLYWMYNRKMDFTINFLTEKFGKKPEILESNLKVLKAGYHYGDTTETFMNRYEVPKAKVEAGTYRSIMGNQAVAMGFVAASQKSGLPLFLASYPITPASDILHDLSKYKNFGVRTMQCEDEIASICAAIGASYGGNLALTTSSGPGIALKGEAIGLAVIMELPLVVVNIQRGGPSTGLPTKTEQADLLQALYGRNGECPMIVISCSTPSDCFETTIEACRLSLEHMTPVMLLSDGYIANGAEPWKFPKASDIKEIKVNFKTKLNEGEEKYLPYKRNEKDVREWVLPGTPELMHRLGGLEKDFLSGAVSYDAENHEKMVKVRQSKVDKVADYIPLQKIEIGEEKGKVLVLGWGSTYGSIKSTVLDLIAEGMSISHAHVRYMNPLPKNLGEILSNFEHVLIPEINNGQFIKVIRDKYLVDAKGYNKIQGTPISKTELKEFIKENY